MNSRLAPVAAAMLLAIQLSSAFAAPGAKTVAGVPARIEFRDMPNCANLTAPVAPADPQWHGRVVVGVKAGYQDGLIRDMTLRMLERPADLSRQAERAMKNSIQVAMVDWRCEKDVRGLDVNFTFERP